ncbi:MAG: MATE family efflux transporter [Tissierellia bacterium]|nr:MATE family efflux transporter [Tissierellia bacterium]
MNKRKILKTAFMPGILGLMGTSLYVLGDTLIVGQALGREGLAALNLSIPMINIMQGLGLLLGFGGATALSRAVGRGDYNRAKQWAEKTLSWSVITGIILLIILQLFFNPLLELLTGGGEAIEGAKEYLGILLWFSPFYVLFQTAVVLLRNDGGSKLAMKALLLCSGINIVLDIVFVFGFSMGLYGAGIATGIAQVIGLIVSTLHFKNAVILRGLQPKLLAPFKLMGKGMSSFVTEISQGIVIFAFNAILISLVGGIGVSSYAIIANLSLMFTAVFLGLAQGAQPILSEAFGAGDMRTFKEALGYARNVNWVLSVIVVLVCIIIPKTMASIFITNDSQVLSMTTTGLRIYSLGFIFLGYNLIGSIELQSRAKNKEAFIFSLARGMLVLISMALLLTSIINIYGTWLAFFASELVGFIWLRTRNKESYI